jgi:MFS family permease
MMLFEYAIWGAWYVTVGTWLGKTLHFSGQEIGAVAGTTAIGAMISPLFVGLMADRLFDTRRVLAALHIIGAVLLMVARWCMRHCLPTASATCRRWRSPPRLPCDTSPTRARSSARSACSAPSAGLWSA